MHLPRSAIALADLKALWDLRRGARPLPARRDFIAEDFQPWFGHIRMVCVEQAPVRLKVTLEGTAIGNLLGEDMTGCDLGAVYHAAGRDGLLAPYLACIETACPRADRLAPGMALRNLHAIERLMLPCGDDGGVTHLIVAFYAQDP